MTKLRDYYESFKNHMFMTLDSLSKWMKNYGALFIIYFGIGIANYFMLMSQNLVNSSDGVKYNSVAYAGEWERSIGRWFWPILDKIRFGIISSPFNTIITLLLISFGCILLIDLFKVKHKLQAILVGALIIATPLICGSLTYGFMSVTFGLAFLLSIVSACCIIKIPNKIVAVIVGAIFLALSMGNYQAYFSVTCLILLIYFMKSLLSNEDAIFIRNYIIKAILDILAGGILYRFVLEIINNYYNVALAAYKNADSISITSIILNLPERIVEAYREFYQFFFTNTIQMTNFGLKYIYILAFIIMAFIFAIIIYQTFKKNVINGCLIIFAIVCLPLACNAMLLITESNNSVITTGGLTLLFPLVLCLFEGFAVKTISHVLYFMSLCVMLWINICIVNNDQVSLMDGSNSTTTLLNNIATELIDDGYTSDGTQLAIIGKPSDSKLFTKTEAWNRANGYAKFGDYWSASYTVSNNNRRGWSGLFVRYLGLTFNFCPDEIYYELVLTDDVQEMPCYPDEGSVKEVGGIVVVKVSDTYY